MSGLFDRLIDPHDDDNDERPSGLTPLDIADLPALQRRIMLTLLRDKDAATKGISQDTLAEKLEHPEGLATALDELAANGWLNTFGDAPDTRYKPALRPKRPRAQGSGLWSALSSRLDDSPSATNESNAADAALPPETPDDHPSGKKPPENQSELNSSPRRPRFPDISKW